METKIYKAYWRAKIENKDFISWNTFNSKIDTFGALTVFNDEILYANSTISHFIVQDAKILLLPIIGGIDFNTNYEEGFVHINQLQVLNVHKETTLTISNPYKNETVRYLHLQLDSDIELNSFQIEFDPSVKNRLHTIYENENTTLSIGMYNGRSEEIHTLHQFKKGVFTFIIQGAFEFQNRLLEAGDALHISETDVIEFEALSENAILLLLEVHPNR